MVRTELEQQVGLSTPIEGGIKLAFPIRLFSLYNNRHHGQECFCKTVVGKEFETARKLQNKQVTRCGLRESVPHC